MHLTLSFPKLPANTVLGRKRLIETTRTEKQIELRIQVTENIVHISLCRVLRPEVKWFVTINLLGGEGPRISKYSNVCKAPHFILLP